MINTDEMQELIDKLNYYTKLYDEGNTEISDAEWDELYFKLQKMEEESGIYMANSPTCHIDYFSLNELKKVKHSHPMLSLNKTKSIQDILDFKNNKDVIAMLKMDGLTCSIRYEQGVLVSAETRGNGEVGEVITHNIVTVKGVPLEIPYQETLVVDGEVICTYKDFELFNDKFANPRNLAAGSIRLLSNKECANRHLSFIVWDVIEGFEDCKTLTEKLYKIDSLGFTFVPHIHWFPDMEVSEDKFNHISKLIVDWAKKDDFQYPYDGLVFKYNDCEYYQSLGETGHHPKGGLAFKFYDEEYETKLLDIDWSLGKTGQITPVAIFEPVDTGDSIIERASVHNLNIMRQIFGENPYKGQPIWVAKQNMIIPQVIRADHKNEGTLFYYDKQVLTYPDVCPVCGKPTVVRDDFVWCDNDECEGQFLNRAVHFCGKKGLDIRGLSKATLQKLIDWGWVGNFIEIFSLSNFADEWKEQPGFGPKSVNNILEAIEKAKDCELWQFISALGIPLIGSTYAKEMAKHEVDWHNIREDIENKFDFTHLENFGPNMDASLHNFDYFEADKLAFEILHLRNSLWINPEEKKKESNVSGKTFVITGKLSHYKNRDELVAAIEAAGGKVVSSVSKNTDYLINNDINSTSSKNVKAKSLNIPIITEEYFLGLL